ncbi:WAT1-related protein At1g09380 [Brachypodium distachyon]|uniref:WAT1-related protein n=1 Tax=Brachypodium distachyon TaxID=15368 RepID=I1I741_BRADI|nr:WAT1-related protein At1g09380 [Brachypodium distachyon]PNT68111.1 hypothetical protein BRADI_3g36057v3 [Brachypodium distachyon]|eukprot:XP_003572197.1 WAT1-related protein At1g09380 [Brachypodium distachyon]
MGCMPTVAMLLVQIGFAGMNLLSKMALDNGMSPYVLVAYRSLVAAVFLAPLAVYFERDMWKLMTKKVTIEIILSSSLGMTLCELLFFVGFQSTSATVASAIVNIVPALTFAIAAALKMEPFRPRTAASQAKVIGTVVCVGGSMVMPFYKGPQLKLWDSPIHWHYAEHAVAAAAPAPASSAVGDVLIILSAVSWAGWLLMTNKTSESFPAPYTSTTIMSLIVGVECGAVSAAVDRSLSAWSLGLGIRLYSVLYMGIIGWGVTFAVMTWCIQVRGPLFVSMFSPVVLVVVALLGWAFLDEKLHLGSAIGAVLIVVGLYMVLWGKGREIISRPAQLHGNRASKEGLGSKENDAENGGDAEILVV